MANDLKDEFSLLKESIHFKPSFTFPFLFHHSHHAVNQSRMIFRKKSLTNLKKEKNVEKVTLHSKRKDM